MLGILASRPHKFPIRPGWEKRAYIEPNTGCVIWSGAREATGYPCIRYQHTNWLLHRLLLLGEVEYERKDVHVCHRCNNPDCINTEHLYAGNPKTNFDDQVAAGHATSFLRFVAEDGEANHQAKLTAAQVVEIRRRSDAGEGRRPLGREFGVHPSTIYLIAKRKKWQSVC